MSDENESAVERPGDPVAPWVFDGWGTCAGCKATIEWWITPLGKRFPADRGLVRLADGTTKPIDDWKKGGKLGLPHLIAEVRERSHFITCPNAKSFRR